MSLLRILVRKQAPCRVMMVMLVISTMRFLHIMFMVPFVLIIPVVIVIMMRVRAYRRVKFHFPLFPELLLHFQDVLDEARVDQVRA
jgi:uncharacterized membrane protein